MSNSNEDVLEMLDSLEKETKAAVSSNKKKEKGPSNADKEDDIMGFLDSLTKNPPSGKNSPALAGIKAVNDGKDRKGDANSGIGIAIGGADSGDSGDSGASVGGAADSVGGAAASGGGAANVGGAGGAGAADDSSSTSKSTIDTDPTASTTSPPSQPSTPDPIASISNWWSRNKGGLWDTATSAVKQAEAKVKEFQPEVQQFQQSQQKALESLGGGISKLGISKGLLQSTFASVLETIAPPISRHEQLKINIFHDMVGYPMLDSIIYGVFEKVMQQVEGGGDLLMIVQKGKERHRRGSDAHQQRELGIFKGSLDQAIKLAAANIEDFVRRSQETTTQQQATSPPETTQTGNESPPTVRVSDVFLSIQPAVIGQEEPTDTSVISPSLTSTFVFIIYLYDPNNDIKFSSISQPFPYQWAEWLDSPDSAFQAFEADPREWVIDWVEEGLGLAVGIAAQSYVAKRMGTDTLFTITKTVAAAAT